MKNFKLLLAATAILTVGTVGAKAELTTLSAPSSTTTVPVWVQLYQPTNITAYQRLSFGGIIVADNTVENTATMNPSTEIITLSSGLRQQEAGEVGGVVFSNWTLFPNLELPASVTLTCSQTTSDEDDNPTGNYLTLVPTKYCIKETVGEQLVSGCKIGGTLTIPAGSAPYDYSGSITVTALAGED